MTPTLAPIVPRAGAGPGWTYGTERVRVDITQHEARGVVYFTAEIWLTSPSQLRSAFSSDKFNSATEAVDDIAMRNGAIVAINGDYATFNNGGVIIRNGMLYRSNNSTRQMLVIDRNGDFIPYVNIPKDAKSTAAALLDEQIRHTLVFGPVLVADGAAVQLPKKFFISTGATTEPRTAIAQLGPLHYMFIVVDGRREGYSQGVSLTRLQELCLEYGAITAFNLDGGGSSTLVFQNNVINKPANGGLRQVPDILYIGE
ncbi:exopolysaccharide biosynthesis protein [Clostridia bacterium]|nr:exopolysaccharide biosynthesis protein [Clostridia bacterium]